MGQYAPIKRHKRARNEIINGIETAMTKLQWCLDTYSETGMADGDIKAMLRQSELFIDKTLMDISIIH